MRPYLLTIATFLIIGFNHAQDLIITNERDTISCKINRISELYIHYTEQLNNQTFRSRIPQTEVESFLWNSKDQVPEVLEPKEEASDRLESDEPQSEPEELIPFDIIPDIPKLRLAVSSGYTYQIEGYENLPNSYTSQVKSLWNIGGELHFYPSENFGMGIKYNRISTPAFEELPTNTGILTIDEDIRFTYIALSLMRRQIMSNEDHMVYYHAAAGVVSYRDDGTIDGIPFFEEGDTFGLALGVGYDYRIGNSMGVGLDLELNLARLNSINVNGTIISGIDFGISRIDITAGIRFFN